ncbi:MAG: HAD family hydrolase [Chloroflexi bacterium]|nr:HAD family hydrolase [Chloroflexota bacterium]
MQNNIEAIFLDVGNTLRIVIEDKDFIAQSKRQLVELTEAQETPDAFHKKLEERYQVLRKRAKEKLIEASEKEMWTNWMLPDFPAEKIAPLSGKLTRLWRDCDGRRVPREDVKETVIELSKRGYLLGIIANTITETEIPDYLETDGLSGYFKTVVLSSKIGIRKPNPEIYWEAARRIGIEPAKCVYVGDNPVRDVEGTRAAGYGMFILFFEPATQAKEPPSGEIKPDYIIHETRELLDIFPPRR